MLYAKVNWAAGFISFYLVPAILFYRICCSLTPSPQLDNRQTWCSISIYVKCVPLLWKSFTIAECWVAAIMFELTKLSWIKAFQFQTNPWGSSVYRFNSPSYLFFAAARHIFEFATSHNRTHPRTESKWWSIRWLKLALFLPSARQSSRRNSFSHACRMSAFKHRTTGNIKYRWKTQKKKIHPHERRILNSFVMWKTETWQQKYELHRDLSEKCVWQSRRKISFDIILYVKDNGNFLIFLRF